VVDYKQTVRFWDEIFDKAPPSADVREPLPYPELEAGLRWLSADARQVLDFGCGTGRLLFRCLGLGVAEVVGIDISPNAVALARRTAERHGLTARSRFAVGSLAELREIVDHAYDGAMLSNVLDNILPDDARAVLAEMQRVVKPGGKLLVKLNDYYPPEDLEGSVALAEIDPNFYRESSGIYLWNLEDDAVEALLSAYFAIERTTRVEFKEHEQWNRLYYLRS
jgi:SAM-dependent methyltransferase